MKGGHTPIHIMRFAPSDYVNDPFVRGLYMKRDYRTAAFYPVFLFYCHMEGGDVSSNVDQLAPLVLMKTSDVVHALAVCFEAGKITEENGRLFHKRVRRQVLDELRYRRQQSKLGKKGGRPKASIDKEGQPKGSLLDNQSPPAPSPAPSPLPAPTPSPAPVPSGGDERRPSPDSAEPTNGNGHGVPEDQRPAYCDQVWSEFLRKSEQPVTRSMTPGEFSVLKTWMDSGVPLRIVLRAMADTRGKGRMLAYFGPSVKAAIESWRSAVPQ